jgi:cell division protein FtsW (lipid II flippase)
MDERRRLLFILSAIFFVLVFGALTIAALATAELNVATLLIGGVSLFVLAAVLIALGEALRRPPR